MGAKALRLNDADATQQADHRSSGAVFRLPVSYLSTSDNWRVQMTSTRNTLIRSMHDVGAAAWFGGALMGAVALNGAANDVENRRERPTIAADGWARWAPVNAAAIGAHLVGGAGLILANRGRVAGRPESRPTPLSRLP